MRVVGRAKIPSRVRNLERKIDKLKKDAAEFFKNTTPIRTGNARSKTKLDRDAIKANYHYATKLNEGYSRQAPDGMTNPTIEFIQDEVRKF